MTNIWGFLIQTLSVTLIAGMLLLIKTLLDDKLSPRWQYGVWSILAIRMLLPVSLQKSLLLPIPVWVEAVKGYVEKQLVSNYSEVYVPARMQHIVPIVEGKPESITDWLFVIYAIGILVSLVWYLTSYMRLRILLNKGSEPVTELQNKINFVCEKYGLKTCKAVVIKGLSSAFVCGGIKPVLALPADKDVDEKVILHELLHLKYHDELQSLAWCVLRSLHWCNPFLQYVFNRIENDMESLCDQRVLERLQGEERRAYGVILLEMANEKYARVPGTSSISNGGKNISRRIAAIVRFKKYPKGMALVSVCIGIVLLFPALQGNIYAYDKEDYMIANAEELEYAMAKVRLNRCTTVAGALDTYAKGLMLENGLYIATASSLTKHEILAEEMLKNNESGNQTCYLNPGSEFTYLVYPDNYRVYNLEKIQKDYYEAYLAFNVSGFDNENGEYCTVADGACLIIPVAVKYEDAWVVEERGERIEALHSLEDSNYPGSGVPYLKQYMATGETGTVKIGLRSYYYVDNTIQNSQYSFFGGTSVDDSVKVDAEFAYAHLWDFREYSYTEDENGNVPKENFGMQSIRVDSIDEEVEFDKVSLDGNSSGSSTTGESWGSSSVDSNGDNKLSSGGGTSFEPTDLEVSYPAAYKVRIYWDGEMVEELTAMETEETFLKSDAYIEVSEAESQSAEYMASEEKIDFKEKKDLSYEATNQHSKEEIDGLIEAYAFSMYEEEGVALEELESCGIFKFETYGSEYPDIYVSGVEMMEPMIFYNANDETWIVVCAGYCNDESWKEQTIAGDVGTRDSWGIKFENTNEKYETYVTNIRGFIADENGVEKSETENLSVKWNEGFGFELQDYTYRKTPLVGKLQYVGYKWYGACTYAPGFEELSGDMIVYYNHTK
ncbi:MAG: hypothetical protein IJZ53_02275 [Tyzzerella sp.]|nr:hypothetical protein [Tyzzerella sp.]